MTSIRRARRGDFDAIRDVFRAAAREAWPHIFSPEALERLELPKRLQRVSGPRHGLFVAELDDAVVGFICVTPSPDEDATPTTGEVDLLYTAPAVWGAGIGRALLDEGLRFLRNARFREVTLWTAEANHRPRRVYEQYGFALDGASRQRTHLGSTFVDVRYRLRL